MDDLPKTLNKVNTGSVMGVLLIIQYRLIVGGGVLLIIQYRLIVVPAAARG